MRYGGRNRARIDVKLDLVRNAISRIKAVFFTVAGRLHGGRGNAWVYIPLLVLQLTGFRRVGRRDELLIA